jgi:hypothetical protein
VNIARVLGAALLVVAAISAIWVVARKISRELPEPSREISRRRMDLSCFL